MARIVCRKSGLEASMEVSGEATIGNAAKVRDMLKTIAEGKQSECTIDLSAITDIDLSFLQLLVSFRMTMQKINKTVKIDMLPEDHIFNTFLRDIGFDAFDFFSKGDRHGI